MIREKLKIYESPSVDPDWDDDPFANLERITSRRAFPFTVDEDPTGSERTSVRRVINEVLLQLKPREERVLRLRFGLGPGERHAHTLDEVGEQFGVSRERIRQIELKAFRQLKHPSRRRRLAKAYFGQSELTARERASVSFVQEFKQRPPAQPPKEGYLAHKDDIDVQRRIASARKANRILREKRERIKSDEAYKEMVDDLTKAWKEI